MTPDLDKALLKVNKGKLEFFEVENNVLKDIVYQFKKNTGIEMDERFIRKTELRNFYNEQIVEIFEIFYGPLPLYWETHEDSDKMMSMSYENLKILESNKKCSKFLLEFAQDNLIHPMLSQKQKEERLRMSKIPVIPPKETPGQKTEQTNLTFAKQKYLKYKLKYHHLKKMLINN